MTAKTELLLLQMLWASGKALRPTFRKLDESFEAWAYRNGLQQQIQRLEARGFVEYQPDEFDEGRFHRLTEAGRIAALGGQDPEASWASEWDRKWRLFLFDVPTSRNSVRRRLTRTLAALGCGCLQGSVWISPNRPSGIEKAFLEDGDDCSHLMVMEAKSRGPKVDRKMAESAWDFEKINGLYQAHLDAMDRIPTGEAAADPQVLVNWAKAENQSWLNAIKSDPMLPAPLLPKGYLGRKAWRKRKTTLQRAGTLAARLRKLAGTQ